ncbi:uncharacterized protein K452DRAFT_249689 [Aplosporella prunicola CBS 121167]|uniref:BHLH domain-containing protein n=1 Tax=Aplosporella prunicola CBS 121167 TaxID=1176127 RepID=A0A6A6BHE3_9PEZI|nr:uncharacterized protein K452DRAFT_249689 [Aplosporella prunicola CBS 121167]KAF2141961.1 hypothetical protein K452DRAFT_249689 [Aplosporella prunicola CBS 121167]
MRSVMSQPDQDPQWSQSQHFESMDLPAQEFVDNLLDFDHIDFDLPIDFSGHSSAPNDHQLSALADSLSSQHLPSSGVVQPQQHDDLSNDRHQQSNNDFFDFTFQPPYEQANHQQPNFHLPQDHPMHSHGAVPPTPNSVEMHGGAARYMHHMDPQSRAILEQRFQPRKEDMASFTPLVSPAVTPHEPHFQFPPEYTVPGAYFSPLTSPALKAQNQNHRGSFISHPHTADTSITTSPIDLDMDMLEEAAIPQEHQPKARKKTTTTPRLSASSGRVRQSPIVKAQHKRKSTLSSTLQAKEVNALLEESQKLGPRSTHSSMSLNVSRSRDASEGESISPEPLSESLMGPPPRPGSVTTSPSILAQGSRPGSVSSSEGPGVCPATPASLMGIQPLPKTAPQPGSQSGTPSFVPQNGTQPVLDDLTLPEAATDEPVRPSMSRLDTAFQDDQSTPRMHARKTPKLGPLSTPSGPLSSSAMNSPAISAVASPVSGAVNAKKPQSGRGKQKRGSVSSTMVSPALRPRISPSIKPLLPQGASMSEDTQAMLLATKSNYQNILEGTHLPGVSYPEALSTNLTSKRTSHKIAEQGRRNRINLALQELQSMIPSPALSPKDAGANPAVTNGGGTAEEKEKEKERQNNSKASTVENAIEYIKLLKKKDEERDRKMLEQREEIEALRKKLETSAGVANPVTEEAAVNGEPAKDKA